MSRRILAIDMRTNHLSAVLLAAGIKSMVIEAFAAVPMDAAEGSHDPLEEAFARLMDLFNAADAAIIVGLPAERSLYRSLMLPFRDEKKIRQILAFELEPALPLPVDQLIFDCRISQKGEGAHVLAAAIERQYLDHLLGTLARTGLRPQLVAPGGYALAALTALQAGRLPEQHLIVDADVDKASVFAFSHGHVQIVRSIPIDMNAADAITVLAAKIRQTLVGHAETTMAEFSPAVILLTGSGAARPDTALLLGQSLDIPVRALDLLQMLPRLELAPSASHWQPTTCDGALALALMESHPQAALSFHRTGSAFHSLWASYKPYLRSPGILLALMLILFLSGVFLDIHRLQLRLDGINTEIAASIQSAFPAVPRISDRPADQMRSMLEEYKKNLVNPTQADNKARVIDVLYQISQLVPEEADVMLDRLVFGGDGMTLSGETNDFKIVEEMKNRLEGSDLFEKVTIASLNRDTSGNNVRFRLKIDL